MSDSVKLMTFILLSGLLHFATLSGSHDTLYSTKLRSEIKVAFVSGDGSAFRARPKRDLARELKPQAAASHTKTPRVDQEHELPDSPSKPLPSVASSAVKSRSVPPLTQPMSPTPEPRVAAEKEEVQTAEPAVHPVAKHRPDQDLIEKEVPLPDFNAAAELFATDALAEPVSPPPGGGDASFEEGHLPAGQPAVAAMEMALPLYDENPKPVYPRVAALKGWEGTVLLEVLVLKDGQVGDVSLLNSSGYRALDKAARKTVYRWKFRPAHVGGDPVECKVQIPINFVLNSARS